MAINELKRYQENAVDELVLKTKLLLAKDLEKRTIIFKAPTGSGKTFMMSQYIEQMIKERENEDICFLWISIGKGGLHKQSFNSLKKIFSGFPICYLLEEEFSGSRKTIDKNEVVVVNWGKLVNKDGQTGEWKNTLMKDKETTNFRELVKNTKNARTKIILIIDESHTSSSSERALEIRDLINADLTIEMSATPILKEGQYNEKIEVLSNDVIDEGMIKKEIIVNENIDKIDDNDITSQELIMEVAFNKRIQLKKQMEKEGADINPLCLVQIPTGQDGEDKRNFIESFLAEKNITVDNHKLAVWLSEEKVNLEVLENNVSEVEFVIFKQAIDTGWDCPRAQILIRFREIQSEIFELQTIGRILRMPEAKHYNNDNLNKAFIYTNIKPDHLDFKGDEISIKNVIKSVHVKRDAIYKSIKLRSYYRNRIDFGDLTMSFYDVLADEFCEYFGIEKNKFDFGFADKNKKKFAKKVDIENLESKDELILNKKLDIKLFDYLQEENMVIDDKFLANLSEDDKERAFVELIKLNLNGFAFKRSSTIFYGALFNWFKKYLGISRLNNGAIYIQNIILNNTNVFGKLFDNAIRRYKPIKDKEIKEKIKEIEEWNNEWEISESRNYNPNTYKPYPYKISLYKHIQDKKAYLNFDSEIEKEFIDILEEKREKIVWWWQNGNEHMALNFGVKYGDGSTFQPDFLVMFKNGTLGIFDTKASGDREDANKIKAEALQRYITEENKRKKKNVLFGGLIIKEGEHFRINSDEKYLPFKESFEVRERAVEYGGKKKQTGWKYFEI